MQTTHVHTGHSVPPLHFSKPNRRRCNCGRKLETHSLYEELCDYCVDDLGFYETQLSLQDSLDLYEEVAA
jgi:hypothetical protein